MDREEYFKRVQAVLKPELARDERVAILGCGSGGARVAEECARFGVGKVLLIDRPGERLEEHNIIRHPLGYRDIGRPKTEAVADHLRNIYPDLVTETAELDIARSRDELRGILEGCTQVVVCTDNEGSRHVANEVAVALGRPSYYAGVYDGGCGGEAARCLPGGACYACIAAYLNRSGRFDKDAEPTFDYSRAESTEKSTSALNLDIAQVALVQARFVLATIMARQDPAADIPGNFVLFGNRPVPGLFERHFASEIWQVPRSPACLVCGASELAGEDFQGAARQLLAQAAVELR